jgi:hypothetical protein
MTYFGIGGLLLNCTSVGGGPGSKVVKSCQIYGNTVMLTPSSGSWMPFWDHNQYQTTIERPNSNTFTGNVFWKGNNNPTRGASTVIDWNGGQNGSTTRLVTQNTWIGNQVGWAGGTATNPLPGPSNFTITSGPSYVPPTTVDMTNIEKTTNFY